ncbi:MAG: GNAT family N-acetyltransferase [Gammaproteobacteria bacterium]
MKNELEPENNILELQTKIIECKKSESHTKHEINISAKFTATASLYYKNQKYGFIYLKINQSSDITKIIGEASFEIRNDNTKKSLQYGPEQSSHSHLFLLCIQKYERKDDKIYHGVGTALMEALFRTSIDLGLGGRLRLVTGRGSEPFHYRLGFRPEADFETYACDLATNQYTKTCSTFFYLPQKAIQEYWAIFEHHNQSLESLPTESFENSKKIRKMMLITDHTKKKTLFGHLLLALHQDQYLLTDSASISEKKL